MLVRSKQLCTSTYLYVGFCFWCFVVASNPLFSVFPFSRWPLASWQRRSIATRPVYPRMQVIESTIMFYIYEWVGCGHVHVWALTDKPVIYYIHTYMYVACPGLMTQCNYS